MSKNDSLAIAVDQKIRSVVLPLEEAGVSIMDPVHIADAVVNGLDPEKDSPELIAYCATMDVRSRVRKFLARRHDPVEAAKDYVAELTDDLFSGVLQDYYPARRPDDSGEMSRVYVRRDEMHQQELLSVAKRMRKAGSALVQHADAVEAYAFDKVG